MAGTGRNAGVELVAVEGIGESLINHTVLLSSSKCSFNLVGALGGSTGLLGVFEFLLVELNIVVFEVPLAEGSGVDLDDAVLDESLGTDELVVGGVVDNIDNSGLTADGFRAPGEGTMIGTEGAVLDVTTTATDERNSLSAKLGISWLTAHFELSFFLVHGHTTTSCSPLMSRISRYAHFL